MTRSRRGFTLIELLTVISIISLLIAMIMPAMSGARQRGRITKCQAQLRELARATLSYLSRNNDFFPVSYDCDNGECVFWNGQQYLGWNGTLLNPVGRAWLRPINLDLGLDAAPTSPNVARIAQCPDDDGAPGQTGVFDPMFSAMGTSYPLNPILCQGAYSDWQYRQGGVTLSQVIEPSRKLLVFDQPAFGLTYQGYWTAIAPGWHDTHRPAATVAFIDSHVEYLKRMCAIEEWQWYAEANGPEFTRQLDPKVKWTVAPNCSGY